LGGQFISTVVGTQRAASGAGARAGYGRRFVIAAVGLLVAGAVVLGGPNSIVAAAIAAGLAGLAAVGLDWAIFHPRRLVLPRVILAGLIGVGTGYYFQLTEARAFQRAFGTAAVESVGDCDVCGHYLGQLGDMWILMRFHVDEGGLERLLSERAFERDVEDEEWWRDEPEGVWRRLFGGYAGQGGVAWREVALPARVRIYRWQGDNPTSRTLLLWDEEGEWAYVLYSFG
jgi:hypothetical protein